MPSLRLALSIPAISLCIRHVRGQAEVHKSLRFESIKSTSYELTDRQVCSQHWQATENRNQAVLITEGSECELKSLLTKIEAYAIRLLGVARRRWLKR